MRRTITISLLIMLVFSAKAFSQQTWPAGLTGRWTFDSVADPEHAITGSDLLAAGFSLPVRGPVANDMAVRLGTGSYFHCYHNIPANGSGSPAMVNRYTLLIDFRINQYGLWRTFFQTDAANSSANDGEVFINPAGNIGVGATGYSSYVVKAGEWYRLVITADLGDHFDYYLDGDLLLNGGPQTPDGRFALSPAGVQNEFLLFADNDGEDHVIDIAQVAVFSRSLDAAEIDSLGGYGHNISESVKGINTYLQTPTPNSVYVSWHSAQTASTTVEYGTTAQLGMMANGSYEVIGTKNWHTVKLSGLTPDTHYYYRVISGGDTSQIYEFRTPFMPGSTGRHLRFVMTGDSQTDVNMPAILSNSIEEKFIELYGSEWADSIAFFMRVGDICGDGTQSDLFEKEYFSPFGNLTHTVPSMVAIGNHETESAFYYQYMKYEDVSDYSYPNPLAERFYSFVLGNCQFIAMNTNGIFQTAVQSGWLHNKLEISNASPQIDLVFTYNHHPFLSEMWPDGNTPWVGNTVYEELNDYPKVMLNCYGHSHNYERGVIRSQHGQPNDFRIMCIGGGGAYLDRWGMYANQTDYQEIQSMYDYYSYTIFDVDIDDRSYTATTYSLGNPDKRMSNVPIETFHYRANQAAPDKPAAISPAGISSAAVFQASAFAGLDTLMSSQFQITTTPGNWSSPLLDSIRDAHDVYGNFGPPHYSPVDLNAGIDLTQLTAPAGSFVTGSTYAWRVRYRDENIKWSEWSDETQFTYFPAGISVAGSDGIKIIIGPNPYSGTADLIISGTSEGMLSADIADNTGRIVKKLSTYYSGNSAMRIRADEGGNDLPGPGIYTLRIQWKHNIITRKMVKLD